MKFVILMRKKSLNPMALGYMQSVMSKLRGRCARIQVSLGGLTKIRLFLSELSKCENLTVAHSLNTIIKRRKQRVFRFLASIHVAFLSDLVRLKRSENSECKNGVRRDGLRQIPDVSFQLNIRSEYSMLCSCLIRISFSVIFILARYPPFQ